VLLLELRNKVKKTRQERTERGREDDWYRFFHSSWTKISHFFLYCW